MASASKALSKQQLDLIRYCIITETPIPVLRKLLVDRRDKDVFDSIDNTWLLRGPVSNQRRALISYKTNPRGRSTWVVLPTGWHPYFNYDASESSGGRVLDPITTEQHQFQLTPPTAEELERKKKSKAKSKHKAAPAYSDDISLDSNALPPLPPIRIASFEDPSLDPLPTYGNMTQFSYIGSSRSPTRSPVRRTHSVPDVPVSSVTTMAAPTGSAGFKNQAWETNQTVYGRVVDFHLKVKLDSSSGLSVIPFLGGGGVTLYCGSNLVTVEGVKHSALVVQVQSAMPVDLVSPFRQVAEVLSKDTILIYVTMGFNSEQFVKMMEEVQTLKDPRLGNTDQIIDTLQAFMAATKKCGIARKSLAITIKNLPHDLSETGLLQDAHTLKMNPKGLTPMVASGLFSCHDELSGEPVYFNGNG